MNEPLPKIELNNPNESIALNPTFKFATDGGDAGFKTEVTLKYNEDELITYFECKDNPYLEFNEMEKHNDPLYNQEVFEIFISKGSEDPKRYLEVEINPNGAMWIGYIDNPALGDAMQTLDFQLEPSEAKIRYAAEKMADSWKGYVAIPLKLISETISSDYRINFYRIRRKTKPHDTNWVCDENNCDFVCWSPTLSGKSPAFHRPKRFGYLKVKK